MAEDQTHRHRAERRLLDDSQRGLDEVPRLVGRQIGEGGVDHDAVEAPGDPQVGRLGIDVAEALGHGIADRVGALIRSRVLRRASGEEQSTDHSDSRQPAPHWTLPWSAVAGVSPPRL